MDQDYHYLFKLIIIGDSGTGKSCILLRFADDTYTDSYMSTIGVDFKIRTLFIDNKIVKLQIWDTAGQERFRAITRAYYLGAHGIIIAYATDALESFEHVDQLWKSEAITHGSEKATIMLVGTKCDMKKLVPREIANEYAQANGWLFAETSSKNKIGVDEAFIELAKVLIAKANKSYVYDDKQTLTTNPIPIRAKNCC